MTQPNESKSIWQSWSSTTKFSVIAFVSALVLTFLSLGALGYLIYYPVAWLIPETIDGMDGDSVWPAVIMAGLMWSFGFLLAGLAAHYLKAAPKAMKNVMYIVILWAWDFIIWFSILHFSLIN